LISPGFGRLIGKSLRFRASVREGSSGAARVVIPLLVIDATRPAMPPKSPQLSDHDLFRMRLDAMIDGRHELVRLAKLIDWKRFEDALGGVYDENRGRPALPTRMLAGLHLLKHIKGLSDEQVCAQWVENPYFQAFCGEEFFRHELPLDRSSMTRWRNRIGPEKAEVLLAGTIAAAMKSGAVSPHEMERVTVDTTVATKAVAHPTDSHLLLRAIAWMNRAAKKAGIVLRQSFLRLAGRARREVGRLLHTGGHAQGLRHLRRMRTFAGRLWRDITRKAGSQADRDARLALVLDRVGRLLDQKPQDRHKLYALHAPEVECIGKGKARVRYEFRGEVLSGGDQRAGCRRPVRARRPHRAGQPL
jgi:IS5 family transposase